MIYRFLPIALAVGLTACGGGSTSGGGSSGSMSFSQMTNAAYSFDNRYGDIGPTPVSRMPSSGTATFDGVAGFSDVADLDYIIENAEVMSQFQMTANFRNDTVSGRLYNFRDYTNQAIPGTVNIRNGEIADNIFGGELSGNLTLAGTSTAVTGGLIGAFAGSRANVVAGVIEANLGSETVYGVFAAD